MRFPTTPLATVALVFTGLMGGSGATAEPIKVLNAAPPPAAPASDCAPAEAGADIECVLSLTPPPPGAAAAPRRIVIRAQWVPKRCAPRQAQVVDLPGSHTRAKGLPTVDQAGSGRTCAS